MAGYTSSNDMKRYNYLTNEIGNVYHEIALGFGISDSSMAVLYTVCDRGNECLLSDVMRLSGISKQTINSAIRKLENEGIIYLKNFTGKKKVICLTGKGNELTDRTVRRVIEIENIIFDSWDEKERELYLELTNRYLVSIKESIKEL